MCGEDGRQRVVYKLKEEHAKKGDREKEKERKRQTKKKEQKERKKNCIDYQRKTIVVPTLDFQYT